MKAICLLEKFGLNCLIVYSFLTESSFVSQQSKSLRAGLDNEQSKLDKLNADISFDENSISSTTGDSAKVDLMKTGDSHYR